MNSRHRKRDVGLRRRLVPRSAEVHRCVISHVKPHGSTVGLSELLQWLQPLSRDGCQQA